MMKFVKIYLFFLVFSVAGCKSKDPAPGTTTDSAYSPTAVSLSIPYYLPKVTMPKDNPLTKEGIELGRMLFYEKALSKDNTISCASCHKQQFAFSDNITFSKGVEGKLGKRNSMALANLVFQDSSFFWDGRARSLEHQALFPIQDPLEMNQSIEEMVAKLQTNELYPSKFKAAFNTTSITGELVAKALAQFERSILSYNSKYDAYLQNRYKLTEQEKRGMDLFLQHPDPKSKPPLRGGNCGDCHGGFLQTFNRFHNNGLDSVFTDLGLFNVTKRELDKAKFRAPSLRNIAMTAPYMHDGRFATLQEVLDHYNEHIKKSETLDPLIVNASNFIGEDAYGLGLTAQEKKDIIVFMELLSDSTLIQNKELSSPF